MRRTSAIVSQSVHKGLALLEWMQQSTTFFCFSKPPWLIVMTHGDLSRMIDERKSAVRKKKKSTLHARFQIPLVRQVLGKSTMVPQTGHDRDYQSVIVCAKLLRHSLPIDLTALNLCALGVPAEPHEMRVALLRRVLRNFIFRYIAMPLQNVQPGRSVHRINKRSRRFGSFSWFSLDLV